MCPKTWTWKFIIGSHKQNMYEKKPVWILTLFKKIFLGKITKTIREQIIKIETFL